MRTYSPARFAALVFAGVLIACTSGNSTSPTPSSPDAAAAGRGVWISPEDLAGRPTSGAAWSRLNSQARQSCPSPNLEEQESSANVCLLAKALVAARTGDVGLRDEVVAGLRSLASSTGYQGRALSLGRELAAYVVAADLVSLRTVDSALDQSFRTRLASLLTTPTDSGPRNLVDCHETRPNNWGTHCGASRVAVASYLGDSRQVERVAQVFRGWLGNRAVYSGFAFGDLSWQCNAAAPVAINPPGCTRAGHSLDGVIADDQRRAGGFTWPPPKENYVYEALQGAVVQAVILKQNGYDAFNWENRALLRAFEWLQNEAAYPPQGDDLWLVPLINHFYGTNYAGSGSNQTGKVMGWTAWTHGR